MTKKIIQRKLWYETADQTVEITQDQLESLAKPIVILGEAGMGKSTLLKWIAESNGHAICTARQLINRHDPKTLIRDKSVLVIDALDEVSAQKDGDAVDLVLQKLGVIDYPPFILSCRVADWRSATGAAAISEQYDTPPLQMHLQQLSDDDAVQFLAPTLGTDKAKAVVTHFSKRSLSGLLANPQTLQMIADIASGTLPETRGDLFASAIEIMRVEHQDSKSGTQPSREESLNAAGATFATLILTGSEALVRGAAANTQEGELNLIDIRSLPGANTIDAVLNTRLFSAAGNADRFTYAHRRIGEYLGAQWLSKTADTDRKRERMLSLFHAYGMVPANLRGLHAWLAKDPQISQRVIAKDPMGVIEYGDADNLEPTEAKELIKALEALAEKNPRFRNWSNYSLGGIAQLGLLDDLRRLIITPSIPYGLRVLVLEAIKGTDVSAALVDDLLNIILDQKAIYATRNAAGDALAALRSQQDWPKVMRQLLEFGDENSTRLAIELMDEIGYDAFSDELIVDFVIRQCLSESSLVGVLYKMERTLPSDRLSSILDLYVSKVEALGKPHSRPQDYKLTDFAYTIIARRVGAGGVSPLKLWAWLRPFDSTSGYHKESREQLNELLQRDKTLRRGIQHYVLLENKTDKNIWQRSWSLHRRSSALALSTEDVAELLKTLDASNRQDERWKDIIQLVQHNGEEGADIRVLAMPFAAHRSDLVNWLDGLAVPRAPEWQTKQAELERKRRAKKAVQWAEARKSFEGKIDDLKAGNYGGLINPAKAYLALFHDIGEGLSPHERVIQWLGEDIANAAFVGFDKFLTLPNPKPTADEIAASIAENKRWEAGYIIVAAFAERMRKGLGFEDLIDERILAGFFEVKHSKIDEHAGISGLEEALETEIRARGLWEEAMRKYLEPQLQHERTHVQGLYELLKDEREQALALKLATEWLNRFTLLPGPEIELIDKLLDTQQNVELCRIAATRSNAKNEELRRTWNAVGLIVDFENTRQRLEKTGIERELLWHLRQRTTDNYGNEGRKISLNTLQIEWIISTFRPLFPATYHPTGVSRGSDNPWDASEFIFGLINRLGNITSDEAVDALTKLRDSSPDGYTETLKSVAHEQARKRVEAAYAPPNLEAVEAIFHDLGPKTAADLQAIMVEELLVIQRRIRSDDVESWRGFYDAGIPCDEERCRDHLLGLLRQTREQVRFAPEVHIAGDREVDIACIAGNIRLPIEIKGQWHADLWHAADTQLDYFYSRDWQAEGRGIYVVLWFGANVPSNKQLKRPQKNKSVPTSPNELTAQLRLGSKAVADGRLEVIVLDISRP